MADLLPSELLDAIAALRLRPPRVARAWAHAEHRSRHLGSSIEFRDYRAYTPGDDLRRLDQHLWQRFRRLFLRLGDDPRERPVLVAADFSASMGFGEPPPSSLAREAALVFLAVAAQDHDPTGLFLLRGSEAESHAKRRSKGALARWLEILAEAEPSGATDLQAGIRLIAALHPGQALLVLISDFYDPAGPDAIAGALAAWPHELALVRVIRPEDKEPVLRGDLLLMDSEDAGSIEVSADEDLLARYRSAFDAFGTTLAELAKDRGASLVELDSSQGFLAQIDRVLETGLLIG